MSLSESVQEVDVKFRFVSSGAIWWPKSISGSVVCVKYSISCSLILPNLGSKMNGWTNMIGAMNLFPEIKIVQNCLVIVAIAETIA